MTANDLALESLHTTATEMFLHALNACSIQSAFDRRVQFEGCHLKRLMAADGEIASLDMSQFKKIFVIAIGKAAPAMLDTLLTRMDRARGVRGICCSSTIPEDRNWRIRYFEGGHPLPNEGSFAAARAALHLLHKARRDTLVIFLISGGASALFDLPLDPEISLEETMVFHQALIASGAPITEINVVRKHFSAVKGGRLALAAPESQKISILLPDVPLRSLDTLASGPTSPDHSTVENVRAILTRYNLSAQFPASIRAFFEREDLPESPGKRSLLAPLLPRLPWMENPALRKGEPAQSDEDAFRNSIFEVLLSSHDLVENARAEAEKLGYYTVVDNSCDDWDYAEAARFLIARFHAIRAEHSRCCLISGGEVTVTLDRAPGAGGRNQQFALACALELQKYAGEQLAVFSAGSDGIDGNTRAAGAIADPTTVSRAVAFGFDPEEALREFNACPMFTALGDSVVTGPTGHNLRDLRLLLSEPTAQ
jgi:hydroxypyruvate reductase